MIGLAFLEEAVADVLMESRNRDEGLLSNRQIRERVGLPEREDNRDLLNIILRRMQRRGEVKPPPKDGHEQSRWELTN